MQLGKNKSSRKRRRAAAQQSSAISVVLEIGAPLASLAAVAGTYDFEQRLYSDLSALVARLGLSRALQVAVQAVDSTRAVRVRTNGTIQPFEPELMARTWAAIAPSELRQLPRAEPSSEKDRFPDGWLSAYIERIGTSDSKSLALVFEFLSRLAVEIIAARPSSLIAEEEAELYLADLSGQLTSPEHCLSAEDLAVVLKRVLDLGVSLSSRASLITALGVAQEYCLSPEDTIESVFTQMRSATVEIHAHPDYLKQLLDLNALVADQSNGDSAVGSVKQLFSSLFNRLIQQQPAEESFSVYSDKVSANAQGQFRAMEERLFSEIGLRLPDIVWVASRQIPKGFMALKINDWLSTPILGLQGGEVFVDITPEFLAAVGEPAQPAVNPRTGSRGSVIQVTQERALRESGTSTGPLEFLSALLFHDLVRNAHRLFGMEDAEYQIAQLKQYFPKLIEAVMSRFSMADLARVLRSLLMEGLPVRDSWSVLEKLLQFDTVTVTSADELILDDRLPVLRRSEDNPINKSELYYEFVRSGYRKYISHKYGGLLGTVAALRITSTETDATAPGVVDAETLLADGRSENFRDAVWKELSRVEGGTPVLLTSAVARAKVRGLVSAEFWEQPVVAFHEVFLNRVRETVQIPLPSQIQSQPTLNSSSSSPEESQTAAPAAPQQAKV